MRVDPMASTSPDSRHAIGDGHPADQSERPPSMARNRAKSTATSLAATLAVSPAQVEQSAKSYVVNRDVPPRCDTTGRLAANPGRLPRRPANQSQRRRASTATRRDLVAPGNERGLSSFGYQQAWGSSSSRTPGGEPSLITTGRLRGRAVADARLNASASIPPSRPSWPGGSSARDRPGRSLPVASGAGSAIVHASSETRFPVSEAMLFL